MRVRLRLLAVALLFGLGCSGYQLVRTGESLGDVRRVSIETLRNDSYEPGIDALVSEALLREFLRRGAARLVRDPAQADLVLSGAVRPLNTRTRSGSTSSLGLEYEVELQLDLSATRADGQVLAFHPGILRDREIYLTSANVEATRKNRDEALRRIAGTIASRVHDALTERLAP